MTNDKTSLTVMGIIILIPFVIFFGLILWGFFGIAGLLATIIAGLILWLIVISVSNHDRKNSFGAKIDCIATKLLLMEVPEENLEWSARKEVVNTFGTTSFSNLTIAQVLKRIKEIRKEPDADIPKNK